jgi:hypothetical protein
MAVVSTDMPLVSTLKGELLRIMQLNSHSGMVWFDLNSG